MTKSRAKVSQLFREGSFCVNSPEMCVSVGKALKTGKRHKMYMPVVKWSQKQTLEWFELVCIRLQDSVPTSQWPLTRLISCKLPLGNPNGITSSLSLTPKNDSSHEFTFILLTWISDYFPPTVKPWLSLENRVLCPFLSICLVSFFWAPLCARIKGWSGWSRGEIQRLVRCGSWPWRILSSHTFRFK